MYYFLCFEVAKLKVISVLVGIYKSDALFLFIGLLFYQLGCLGIYLIHLYQLSWSVIGIIPNTFPIDSLEMELFFVLARRKMKGL